MKRAAVVFCALVLLIPASAQSNEANQAMLRKLVDEVYNKNKVEVIDEIVAEDLLRIGPTPETSLLGREAFGQYVAGLRSAYPDFELSIESMATFGQTVVMSWRFKGTNTGPGSYPPTGKALDLSGTSHITFDQGKIAIDRVNWDALGASQQLGLPPTPGLLGVWTRTKATYSNPDTSWVQTNFQNNLMLISKGHYSIMRINSETPRKLFNDRRNPAEDEKLEAYNTFNANSGIHEVSGDSITFHPIVAKNPNYMSGESTTAKFIVSERLLRLTYTGTMRQNSTKTWVYHLDLKRIE